MTDLTLFLDVTKKQEQECFEKTEYTKIYIVDYLQNRDWGTNNKILRRLGLIYQNIHNLVEESPRKYSRDYRKNLKISSIVYIPNTEVPKFEEILTRIVYEIIDSPTFPNELSKGHIYLRPPIHWWEWYITEVFADLDRTDNEFIVNIIRSQGLNYDNEYRSGGIIINYFKTLIGKYIPGVMDFEFEALRILTKDVVCQL